MTNSFNGPDQSSRLLPSAIDQMMTYLLTDSEVCSHAQGLLQPEHFSAEPQYRILWQAVLALTPEYGLCQIPYDALQLHVQDLLRGGASDYLSPALQAVLIATPGDVGSTLDDGTAVGQPGIIHYAYHDAAAAPKRASSFGMSLLRRFLQERAAVDQLRGEIAKLDDSDSDGLGRVLSEINTKLVQIKSVGSSVCFMPTEFPEDPEPIPIKSTGVNFLDVMMDGGHADGEVQMLLGLQKSGKTLLMTEMCTASAENYYQIKANGGDHFVACFFSFEMPRARVVSRFYAAGADVSLTELDRIIKKGSDYSTRGNLKPYEIEYYSEKGLYEYHNYAGERERIAAFNATVGHHIANFDMTGYVSRNIGSGGIDEVVAFLNQLAATGKRPGVVVIDYLGLMLEKQIAAEGGDTSKLLRTRMLSTQIACFDRIAIPFQVPVWLIHQYNAESQKASPTKLLRTGDASDARTLGAAVNFSFCMCPPDPETLTAQFLLDLSRRSRGQTVRLIQRQAERGRWIDVNEHYYVDKASDRILPQAGNIAGAGLNAAQAGKFQGPPATVNPYAGEAAMKKGKKKGGDDDDYIG